MSYSLYADTVGNLSRRATFCPKMKKVRKKGLTNQKSRVEYARSPAGLPKPKKERKRTMIKTITIILGLAAGVATANTLPPTPEAPAAVKLR